MIAEIKKSYLSGEAYVPASKSMAHRLLICAGLSNGTSIIKKVTFSEDILATLDCLSVMGAEYEINENTVKIKGVGNIIQDGEKEFDCRESGSTLRFFIPLMLLSDKNQTFRGKGRLMERPQSVYEDICKEKGLRFDFADNKITVCGKLTGGHYYVRGDISSQFITGLLFALSKCENDSFIHITTPLESRSYIDMTFYALSLFSVSCSFIDENTICIKGNQDYIFRDITVEGDYSASAFLEALNYLGGKIIINGLNEKSFQGDRVYKDYFKLLSDSSPTLDVSDCPDLAPILMTLAAAKNGAVLTGTKRLKIKESDRGAVMASELSKFGANIEVYENEIVIRPSELYKPTDILYGHNDHRVVMSLAVLSTVYGGRITDAEAVRKSYPGFFETLSALGTEVLLYDN